MANDEWRVLRNGPHGQELRAKKLGKDCIMVGWWIETDPVSPGMALSLAEAIAIGDLARENPAEVEP